MLLISRSPNKFPWDLLAPQSKPGDQSPVPFRISPSKVLQKAATFPDHHQQATTAVVIMLVFAKVLGQVPDASG